MYEKGFIPFLDACLNQSAAPGDAEAYVEYWHTHEVNCSLREYLGMSAEEYGLWLKRGDDALPEILESRKERQSAFYGILCPYCHAKSMFPEGNYYRCRLCGASRTFLQVRHA